MDHARDHMYTKPLAVSGRGGHDTTFAVACDLVRRFSLNEEELLTLMREYNRKLEEKWTEKELCHKVADALTNATKPRRPASSSPSRKPWYKPLSVPKLAPRIEWEIIPKPLPAPAPVWETRQQNMIVQPDGAFIVPPTTSMQEAANVPTRAPERLTPDETVLRDVRQPGDCGPDADGDERSSVSAVPYDIVTDPDELAEIAARFAASGGAFALDIETYGPDKPAALDPWRGEIRLLSLAAPDQPPVVIDLRAVGYDLGSLAEVLDDREVIIHNAGFDALWLREKCRLSLPRTFCTMTAARLLHVGDKSRNNRLGTILEEFCGVNLPKGQGGSDWSAPLLTPEQLAYAANDVAHLHALKTKLASELDAAGLSAVFQLEMDLLPVVRAMEGRGFAVDCVRLQEILADATKTAETSKTKVQRELGIANPGSPKQVREALKKQGLNLPSTSAETLKEYGHPAADLVLAYREVDKRRQQAQTLLDHVQPDGRIHGRFNPMGADSGRFSSSEPNLQNVGRGDLRAVFTAASEHVLVVADYSQIELRIAAAVAGETTMIDAFHAGDDLHRLTASMILGKSIAEVAKDERQLAKAVNFGLLFGQSPPGLRKYAKNSYGVEISEDEARRFHGKFFDAYPKLRQWHEQARRMALTRRVRDVRTISGRRRLLPNGSGDEWLRFTSLVNTPVQGAAADAMKRAMVTLARSLPVGAGIVSTVHDELIVETPVESAENVQKLVSSSMIAAMESLFPQVPIEVDAKICRHWGEK